MASIAQLQENSVPVTLTRFQFVLTAHAFVERMTPANTVLVALEEEGAKLTDERTALITNHEKARETFILQRATLENSALIPEEEPEPEPANPKRRKKKTEGEAPPVSIGAAVQGEEADARTQVGQFVDAMEGLTGIEQIQKQVGALDEEFTAATKQLSEQLDEVSKRIYANACARVAHLLKSWDLTEADDQTLIATDAPTVEATFRATPEIILGWVERTGEKDEEGQDQFEGKPGLLALMEAARFGPLGI